jgi:hypothetical protein
MSTNAKQITSNTSRAKKQIRLNILVAAVAWAYNARPSLRTESVFGPARPWMAIPGALHGHPLLADGWHNAGHGGFVATRPLIEVLYPPKEAIPEGFIRVESAKNKLDAVLADGHLHHIVQDSEGTYVDGNRIQ